MVQNTAFVNGLHCLPLIQRSPPSSPPPPTHTPTPTELGGRGMTLFLIHRHWHDSGRLSGRFSSNLLGYIIWTYLQVDNILVTLILLSRLACNLFFWNVGSGAVQIWPCSNTRLNTIFVLFFTQKQGLFMRGDLNECQDLLSGCLLIFPSIF